MDFTRSLSALVVCASVAGCAAGQTWDMAAGPSSADWSYGPDLRGYSDDLFLQQLWQQGSGAEKAFGMAPGSPLNPGSPNSDLDQLVQNTNTGANVADAVIGH